MFWVTAYYLPDTVLNAGLKNINKQKIRSPGEDQNFVGKENSYQATCCCCNRSVFKASPKQRKEHPLVRLGARSWVRNRNAVDGDNT